MKSTIISLSLVCMSFFANATIITVNTNVGNSIGTLPYAIAQANASPDMDTILFNISWGQVNIDLTNTLSITNPVFIDGTSQPGFFGSGDYKPVVTLNNTIGGPGNGVEINTNSCVIKGINIVGFNGAGIRINGSANTIQGCHIGVDYTGNTGVANDKGIMILGSSNLIGGSSPAERNVISGNTTGNGIEIYNKDNTIKGNYFGITSYGLGVLNNNQDIAVYNTSGNWIDDNIIGGSSNGIYLQGSSFNMITNNMIGLAANSVDSVPNNRGISIESGSHSNTIGPGNVISKNGDVGLYIANSDSTIVIGNKIGISGNGLNAKPNNYAGISLWMAKHTMIGGLSGSDRNIVSSNLFNIEIVSSDSVSIIGNYIGLAYDGSMLGGGVGVRFTGSHYLQLGGATPAHRNIISGHNDQGVRSDTQFGPSHEFKIQGNYIGTDSTGTIAHPNGNYGIAVNGENYLIGGPNAGEGNLIAGNPSINLYCNGKNALIQGNYIGVDITGDNALSNTATGIYITSSSNAIIGGDSPSKRNIIAGNNTDIYIGSGDSTNVIGNYIGLNATGTQKITGGNPSIGIKIENSQGCRIGGNSPSLRNVIAGHPFTSIGIFNNTNNTAVIGNFVGTNASGTSAINSNYGIAINFLSSNNYIGGSGVGDGNVISGLNEGIFINSTGRNHYIENNLIGTDYTGTAALPNINTGIIIQSPGVSIGVDNGSTRNIISGNGGAGIFINSDSVEVYANNIGLDINGAPLGNGGAGVSVYKGNHVFIGKGVAPSGNSIAYNGGNGIRVNNNDTANTNVLILSNTMYQNGGLGIDLVQGAFVTLNDTNDSLDLDAGPNKRQNYPLVGCVKFDGTNTIVDITLDSEPNRSYLLQLFDSDVKDPSGYGEGLNFLGQYILSSDANGHIATTVTLTGNRTANYFTATASDVANLVSSEFGPSVRPLNVSHTAVSALCMGDSTGLATIHINGGFAPYSFLWDNSSSVDSIANDLMAGTHIVSVKSSNGCLVHDTITIVTKAMPVTTVANNGPYCDGQGSISLSATGGDTYLWNGPRVINNTQQVLNLVGVAQVADSGLYTVLVTNTTSGCSKIDSTVVVVNHLDNASFAYWGSSTCTYSGLFHTNIYGLTGGTFNAPPGVLFVNSNGSIDPSTSIPGTYVVTYTTNGACPASYTDTISINAPPTANFTNGVSCSADLTQFTDASTSASGSIVTYNWDFGDGGFSNLASPTHTFASPAIYNVSLMVMTDQGCTNSINQSIAAQPSPSPSYTVASVCSGDSSVFNNTSAVAGGYIASVAWDFGDGASSLVISPSHTYANPGIYNVQLIAVSDQGCKDTIVQSVDVFALPIVSGGPATVDICLGTGITLNASGANTYVWTDDVNVISNASAILVNPTSNVLYTVYGTDVNGCKNNTNVLVNVNNMPVPNFTSSGICANNPTQFTDLSTVPGSTIVAYAWTFGDGGNSNSLNPTHNYAVGGSYNVYLTVTSAANCVSSAPGVVTIDAAPIIHGAVTYDSLGTIKPILNGSVTLFSVDANHNILSSISQNLIGGNYSFTNFELSGNYIVLSSPDSAMYYPNVVSQYHNGYSVWDSVQTIFETCGGSFLQDIQHKYLLDNMGGSGTVSGYVYKPYGRRPGEPVIGVDVSIDQVPGGMQAMRTTDTTGYYEFNNVPDGTFILYVNIPGKPMDSTYTITMNSGAGDLIDTNKIFFADSTHIFISDSILVVTGFKNKPETALVRKTLDVYPNPLSTIATLKIESDEPIKLEITSATGAIITAVDNIKSQSGVCYFILDKEKLNLSPGIYYLRVIANSGTQVVKLITK